MVEVPGEGDHVRDLPHRSGGMSAVFVVNVNRSKRSLTLDLKTPEGVAVLKKLVASADVVVQNFRPGVVERLGVGYEDLVAENPKLAYLSMVDPHDPSGGKLTAVVASQTLSAALFAREWTGRQHVRIVDARTSVASPVSTATSPRGGRRPV